MPQFAGSGGALLETGSAPHGLPNAAWMVESRIHLRLFLPFHDNLKAGVAVWRHPHCGLLEKRVTGLLKRSVKRLCTTRLARKAGPLALILTALATPQTQNAVANGDTRTINLYHTHTGESISATFRVNGSYDYAVLDRLNTFLRDWRNNDTIKMDPRLFDVVWETYRETGSHEAVQIVSAYRSPVTNAMLRRRSRAVAEHSQHMLGKAMDMHYTDVSMSRVREIAMRLQRGGVGYYPTANSPFVHLDVGSVRAWPRMTYDQLARLFPDGKTVHLAASGQTLARYEDARAMVEARNGVYVPTIAQVQSKGFFATLFGLGEDEPATASAPAPTRVAAAQRAAPRNGAPASARVVQPAATLVARNDDSNASFFLADAARRGGAAAPPAAANLPTAARPAPAPTLLARAEPKPTPIPEPPAARPQFADDAASARQLPASVASFAPLPPRRPTNLPTPTLVAYADVPLPPSRPGEFSALAETPLRTARANDLPAVITGGKAVPASLAVLAYASDAASSLTETTRSVVVPAPRSARPRAAAPNVSQSVGLRAASRQASPAVSHEMVAVSRLDRSNFRTMTSPLRAADFTTALSAPVITGLRAASRTNPLEVIFAAPTSGATHFEKLSAASPAANLTLAAARAL